MNTPLLEREMLERAARAVGKLDYWGKPRGIDRLSTDEIEAMCVLLVCLGLVAVPPNAPMPDSLLIQHEKTEVSA